METKDIKIKLDNIRYDILFDLYCMYEVLNTHYYISFKDIMYGCGDEYYEKQYYIEKFDKHIKNIINGVNNPESNKIMIKLLKCYDSLNKSIPKKYIYNDFN